MAPTDDNSVPGINVADKNGAAFPVMGNATTGSILVASAGRGTGAISNAPKDANHVSGLIAKDKATGKAFAVQGNKDTGAIFVQDLNGGGGGGAATWGSITGDISDNAELTRALDKKADKVINAFSGTGQPNGKVSAPPGSEYTDTAVTCGAVKWIKMWGTGNTGWTVLYGDTGWRSTPECFVNGWTAGKLLVRRVNNAVHLLVDQTKAAGATGELVINLPAGFRPLSPSIRTLFATLTHPAQVYRSYILGNTLVVPNTSKTTPVLSCTLSFVTNDNYSTTLPGTAD